VVAALEGRHKAAVLVGAAGIGKSTVAVEAAWELCIKGRCTGGAFVVDFAGMPWLFKQKCDSACFVAGAGPGMLQQVSVCLSCHTRHHIQHLSPRWSVATAVLPPR